MRLAHLYFFRCRVSQGCCQGRVQNFSLGDKIEKPKAESGVGFPGRDSNPLPTRGGGSGERCELPSGVWGGAPTARRFFHYFQHSGGPLLTITLWSIGARPPWRPLAYAPGCCVTLKITKIYFDFSHNYIQKGDAIRVYVFKAHCTVACRAVLMLLMTLTTAAVQSAEVC